MGTFSVWSTFIAFKSRNFVGIISQPDWHIFLPVSRHFPFSIAPFSAFLFSVHCCRDSPDSWRDPSVSTCFYFYLILFILRAFIPHTRKKKIERGKELRKKKAGSFFICAFLFASVVSGTGSIRFFILFFFPWYSPLRSYRLGHPST